MKLCNCNMKKIDAIFFDLDGTLLNSEGTISNKVKESIVKLNKCGIGIYIATGRGGDALDIVRDIPYKGIIINNGMKVYCSNVLIENNTLSKNELVEFYKKADELGLAIGYFVGNYHYKNHLLWEVENEISGVKSRSPDKIPDKIDKMYIKIIHDNDMKVLYSIFPTGYKMSISRDGYVFVLPINISKYSGIKKVLDYENIELDNVMAFGDDLNDYEMIKKSGIGVAMGNAIEEIKEIADWVTEDNDGDGIFHIMEQIYFLHSLIIS